jgi:hypothetical protein
MSREGSPPASEKVGPSNLAAGIAERFARFWTAIASVSDDRVPETRRFQDGPFEFVD